VVTTTDDPATTDLIGGHGTGHAAGTAGFAHRDDYKPSKSTRCAGRARLNPSGPSKAGSLWYHTPVSVNTGFETVFTFQVSDHSRECSHHKDPAFSTFMYESCSTHGGDGFAFVLHRDPEMGLAAVGSNGRGLGYDGIANSLAVEFDTWYNPGGANKTAGSSDLFPDHVAIHSKGAHQPNSAKEDASFGQQRIHASIGDGKTHLVKIVYVPFVAMDYVHRFSASPNMVQYLLDNDESRRLGTLLVFVDEGVGNDEPLLAVPVNLSVLLSLPQDEAYVGFTASTGLKWEKHDILAWAFCDKPHLGGEGGGCSLEHRETSANFDYAQKSKSASAHHPRYVPGPGFGGVTRTDTASSLRKGGTRGDGGGADGGSGGARSTRHESPDSEASLDRAKASYAPGSTEGEHEHGSAFFTHRLHHSKGRDEGLLEAPSGDHNEPKRFPSDTQTSSAARTADARMQVPAHPAAPAYEAAEEADPFFKEPGGRFSEGTEMRRE